MASAGQTLVGREQELDLLASVVTNAGLGGAALVLTGEPGTGKSALLGAATEMAAGRLVLRAAGNEVATPGPAPLTGAPGLAQLLGPVGVDFDHLPPPFRTAISAALGPSAGPPIDRLILCNAVLTLLRRRSGAPGVLVVVDDLQWLDQQSAVVLAFAARRLAGSRIGFIAAARTAPAGPPAGMGWPEHALRPLDDGSAARLLGTRFPMLAARVHQRVLADAQGNPLALLELPAALTPEQRIGSVPLPPTLPLSPRLADVFASRVGTLPSASRALLLLAALEGSGDLRVVEAAAGPAGALDHLAPAEQLRLIGVDDRSQRLLFRHPLVRATVIEVATLQERRQADAALAQALEDQPDRRALHLAEATTHPDERIAALLEQTAAMKLRTGDATGAVTAWRKAAELSPQPSQQSRRLAEAAYIGADVTGELAAASRLLQASGTADPGKSGSLATAVAGAHLLLNRDGDVDAAHRLLVAAIDRRLDMSDDDQVGVAEALYTLMLVCFFGGRVELWGPFEAFMSRLGDDLPDTLRLCASTFPDPVRRAAPALPRLAAAIDGLRDEADPTRIIRIGIAAFYSDRLSGCRESCWAVVQDGRAGGALGSAINALMLLCFDDLAIGQWDEAQRLADEAVELCELHGYELLAGPGRLAKALIAAARGDEETVSALTGRMTEWAAPRGARSVAIYAWHARTLAALGSGDFDRAYRQACAISPAGELAPYTAHALCVLLDLVEAAVRTDRLAEARAHVAAMLQANVAAISPRLAVVSAGCAAMVADDRQADQLYEQALAVPGGDRWPFEFARVQLAYGEHLRRTRSVARSRPHLMAAIEVFGRLGARPWQKRAADELRASGQTSSRPHTAAGTDLTAAELEIATLAASGLTNKQIGERLYLSHRTVGAHLYQVFPKLGVTSRAALRDALGAARAG